MPKLITVLVLVGLLAFTAASCVPNPEPTEMSDTHQEVETDEEATHPEGEDEGEAPHIDEDIDVDEDEDIDVDEDDDGDGDGPMTMALTSPVFNHEEAIPEKFSCDGEDISPELDWFGTPEGTVSMALIMDDPDAPGGDWVHWVLYNLPMDLSGLREGMTGVGLDGTNSGNRTGYGGPCPPTGIHRYFFKLYALDKNLDLESGADKGTVLEAMEGHVLGEAELMGTYSR